MRDVTRTHLERTLDGLAITRHVSAWESGYPATLKELAAGLRRREFSCVELTSQVIVAAFASQPSINAFITITDELALTQAEHVDREFAAGRDLGPLMGVPFAIKDVFDVEGVATTAGSRLFEENIAASTAEAVQRLIGGGAVVIGKANMDQFAIGPNQEDYGRTNCPAAPDRYAGGSSCGSAAAVAGHLSLAALGTDAGGSTRFPAACCGVVGLKPSFARLPTSGVFPTLPSLDHVGLIAGTVDDVGQAFGVMADSRDKDSVHVEGAPRIGVLMDWEPGCDARVVTAIDAALVSLAERGAYVFAGKVIDGFDRCSELLGRIAGPEALDALDRLLPVDGAGVPAGIRDLLDHARAGSMRDFELAEHARPHLQAALDAALADMDVIAMPTIGSEAWRWSDIDAHGRAFKAEAMRFLPLANLTGHPAISVPIPSEGLPVGLQLIGRRGHDEFLIDVARWVEQHLA